MATHELKTWPEPFAGILDGSKRHEVRKNDRGYAVGDVLHLREWEPDDWSASGGEPAGFTGRKLRVRVTHLTAGGSWGLPADVCVMSIEPERRPDPAPLPVDVLVSARQDVIHVDAGPSRPARVARDPAPLVLTPEEREALTWCRNDLDGVERALPVVHRAIDAIDRLLAPPAQPTTDSPARGGEVSPPTALTPITTSTSGPFFPSAAEARRNRERLSGGPIDLDDYPDPAPAQPVAPEPPPLTLGDLTEETVMSALFDAFHAAKGRDGQEKAWNDLSTSDTRAWHRVARHAIELARINLGAPTRRDGEAVRDPVDPGEEK